MSITSSIQDSIANYTANLTTQIENIADSVANAANTSISTYFKDAYSYGGKSLEAVNREITDAVKNANIPNFNNQSGYDFVKQGTVDSYVDIDKLQKPTKLQANITAINTTQDKNIPYTTNTNPDNYTQSLWTNYSVSANDFKVPDEMLVSLDTYVNYVHSKYLSDSQDVSDEFDKNNGAVCGKGFMFPNSAATYTNHVLLSKYIKTLSDRARQVWEELVKQLYTQIEQIIAAGLDKINYDLDFNKQFADITAKIDSLNVALYGITNDINVKRFELTQEQLITNNRVLFEQVVALYDATIKTNVSIFDTKLESVKSKWDVETSRVEGEYKIFTNNLTAYTEETELAYKKYNTQIQAIYDGLTKDLKAYELEFKEQQRGYSEGFNHIIESMRSAAQSVIGVSSVKE